MDKSSMTKVFVKFTEVAQITRWVAELATITMLVLRLEERVQIPYLVVFAPCVIFCGLSFVGYFVEKAVLKGDRNAASAER